MSFAQTSAKQPRSLTPTKSGHLATSRWCHSPRSPMKSLLSSEPASLNTMTYEEPNKSDH
jgi:hypothetical protein